MKFLYVFLICFGLFVFLFVVVNLVNWWHVSRQHYVRKIKPGEVYKVNGVQYKVPNLDLKGNAMLLEESFMIRQKNLLKTTTIALDQFQIEYWLSGGTLLGFERHKTIIPWDDDCDLHTHWRNRSYMFSRDFSRDVKIFDLEVIFLRGSSIKKASREGAAVRIRKKGTLTPVVDIFFVLEQNDVWGKVDKWNGGKIKLNKKEQWKQCDLFPLIRKKVDNLLLSFPQNTLNVLKKQYGENVMTSMHARNVLFSHAYPFSLKFMWWKF